MLRALAITAALGLVAIAVPVTAVAYELPAPYGLHRTASTSSTLTLDWRDAAGASGYSVQLSKHPDMSKASYYRYTNSTGTMRQLSPLTRYYFRVAVMGANGERLSLFTAQTYPSAYTRNLAGPANLTATARTESSVGLTWSPTSTADAAYRIAVSRTPDFASVIRLGSTSPSTTVTGLDTSTDYYFRVLTVRPDGTAATRYSSTVLAATTAHVEGPADTVVAGPADVRVASYNVQSVSLDKTSGEQRPWRDRRPGVLAGILGEDLDVVGLQEANHGSSFASRLVDGTTQYEDIRNGLNSGGQNFELTNPYAANCVNAATSYNCTYQDRGVAGSDRILYNSDRIALVSQGGYFFPTQDSAGTPRNLAYAVLRVRKTGDEFLFTNTHLEASDEATRQAQWYEMIAKVNSLKGSLPVVAVGDYNVHKFSPMAATMLPAMKSAGMGDVLNQAYKVNPSTGVRAKVLTNGWINTVNHLDRDVKTFSYHTRKDLTGNNIDWVFATNSLAVKDWEVVVDYDPNTLQMRGIIPSDHNMVRATITLP